MLHRATFDLICINYSTHFFLKKSVVSLNFAVATSFQFMGCCGCGGNSETTFWRPKMDKQIRKIIDRHLTADGTNTIWWALREAFDVDIDDVGGLKCSPKRTIPEWELWQALGGVLLDDPNGKINLLDLLNELGQITHDKELEE